MKTSSKNEKCHNFLDLNLDEPVQRMHACFFIDDSCGSNDFLTRSITFDNGDNSGFYVLFDFINKLSYYL